MKILHFTHLRLSQAHQPRFLIEQIHEVIVFAPFEVTK